MSKKFIAMLLTLMLVLTAWTPAFAGEAQTAQDPAKSTVAADTASSEGTAGNSTTSQNSATAADTETPASGADVTAPDQTSEGTGAGTGTSTDSAIGATAEESTDGTAGSDTLTDAEKEAAEKEAAAKAEAEKAAAEKAEKEAAEKAKAEAAKKAAAKKAEKYRNGLASYMRSKNGSLSKSWSKTLADYFIAAGKKYNVDPTVLMAIAQRESTFRASATSPYGIKGMMQTSDALARQYGYKPSSLYKAKVSIDVGARYLGAAKKKFGTYTKALSAYVYGSYAVSKGKYSKSHANAMLKTRRQINAYLKKYDFI